MRGLSLISALSPIQLKTAASRNDPPIKTLGLKLQNNSMTTSVRSRNSILSASACSMRRVCGISRLQKTLSLVLVLPISLATSIFAPLRHLKPIRGALLQPHLITDLLRAGTSARGPQLRKTHMSCFYSPLHGSYAHNTINYRPFSATRHKAGCKSVKATASRALIKHSINCTPSLQA